MGIYRQPPSPFIGGSGPLIPGKLPLLTGSIPPVDSFPTRFVATLAIIIGTWQPSYALPQRAKFVAQPTVVVAAEQPPTRWLHNVLDSWKVESLQVQTRKLLPPSITAVAVDDPPFDSRTDLSFILTSWRPSLPLPQISVKNTFPVADVFVPYVRKVISWDAVPWYQLPRKLSPSILAVPVDDPPFTSRTNAPIILDRWTPLLSRPQLPRKLIPFSVLEDNPPFGQRIWLSTTIESWNLVPPRPILPFKLIQQRIDNPPFRRRSLISEAIWRQEFFPIQIVRRLPASLLAAPYIPPARTWYPVVLNAWQSVVFIQSQTKLIQPFVQIDNPPFGQRTWMTNTIRSWQPTFVQPQISWKFSPATPTFTATEIRRLLLKVGL